jgi:plastocyanin
MMIRVTRPTRAWTAAGLGALVGLGATLLLGTGCGTSGAKIGVREATARPDAEGVQRVDVNVHSFYFDPNRITVKAGKPVDLTLHFKPVFTPHNMTCEAPEAGIQIDRSVGIISFSHTKHVRFTPTKRGEYDFYCGVDSHMRKGMTGTIVVR